MQRLKKILVSCVIALVCCGVALAQTGSIKGTVSDSSGAAIEGAQITAVNRATSTSRTTMSGPQGTYSLSDLPVGAYEITVKEAGFRPFHLQSVELTVAQALTVNPKMDVGIVTEEVQVGAGWVQDVDLESAQVSNLVDQKQITDLPLITRNPYQLTLLSPGTSKTNTPLGGITVNGSRERNNNFLLDGVDNNDTSVPGTNNGVLTANPDAIEEFRIITNNFNAEFGRNTGAVVDVVTKSGGNPFHGDVYEFGRWNGFGGARDWFNPASQGPMNPYTRNQFGFSLGGPIRKDKTFFFFNQEFHRFVTTLTNSATVPTAAFKTGVFTYTDSQGNQVPVDLRPSSAQNTYGLPLDSTMQQIFALYPNPTVANADGFSGTLFFPSVSRENTSDSTFRIDHHFNDRHTLSLRYAYDNYSDPNPFHYDFLPGGVGGFAEKAINQGLGADLTSVFSNTLVNKFDFGWNHINSTFNCNGLSTLDSANPLDQFGSGRDYVMDPFSTFGCARLESDGQYRRTGTISYSDAITWVHGSHTWKFGGEFRDIRESGTNNFFSRRQVYTDTALFGGPDLVDVAGAGSSLQDAAAALYGFALEDLYAEYFDKNGVRQATDLKFFRQHEYDGFVQDSWKARSNLTLNLGVRYQFNGVPYEEHGNFSNFATPAAFPVVFTLVGPGTGQQLFQNDYSGVEPRVGISWDPWSNGKTAIRAGFGIFHDRVFGNLFGNARGNPPFEQDYFQFPYETVNDAFGSGAFPAVPPATTPSATVPDGLGIPATVFDSHFRPTVSNNWSFTIQRELAGRNAIELGYVGSKGTHIPQVVDGDPPDPALVNSLVAYCTDPNNAFGCIPAQVELSNLYFGGGFSLPYNAVAHNALFQPNFNRSIGNSNYNALQVKFNHRMDHGLELQASYTWSHALDNANDPLAEATGNRGYPRNSLQPWKEYGNSDNDVRHIAVVSYIWELPLGSGKKYLNGGTLGKIFEGMQLSGTSFAQTGHPFDVFTFTDMERTGVIGRADLVGDPFAPGTNPNASSGKVFFPNIGAFSDRYDSFLGPLFTGPGSSGRNHFFGPGYVDFNLAFSKNLRLSERFALEARIEGYNVLNHPQFANPGADAQGQGNMLGSPLFGVITSTVSQPDGTTSARQLQVAVKLKF